MLQSLLISTTLAFSLVFFYTSHPLAMGLILLTQTVLVCLMVGQMFYSFWFSYILFLIFLGGMLVLFLYVTSLASNEMFSFSTKMTYMFLFITILMFFIMSASQLMNESMENMASMSLLDSKNFISDDMISMSKLYNFPSFSMNIMLVLYLFITLVACVKITNMFYGPLRQMK